MTKEQYDIIFLGTEWITYDIDVVYNGQTYIIVGWDKEEGLIELFNEYEYGTTWVKYENVELIEK